MVNYTALTPVCKPCRSTKASSITASFWRAERGGFRGSVAYEMCSPLMGGGSMENLDRYAARFLEFFHEFRERTGSVAAD